MRGISSVFFVIILSFTILTACGSEEDVDQLDENGTTEVEKDNEELIELSFDGNKLVTEDYSIEITDHKILQPGEGNNFDEMPILAFWYDVTVNEDTTDEEIDPGLAWIMIFEAIQDNDPNAINELNVGILPDEDHLDSQSQIIKPGGTVSSSVSYELTDEKTPVELIAIDNTLTGEEIGSHEYTLE